MMTWLAILRKIGAVATSRAGLASLAVALFFLGRACHRNDPIAGVIAGQSVRLEDTREAARMPVAPSLTCPDLPVLQPSQKQREKLAERFNRPDLVQPPAMAPVVGDDQPSPPLIPPREILALKKVPPAEYGGEVLASRVSGQRVDLDFRANRAPFLDFPGRLYLEGVYGRASGSEPLLWLGRARADLLRVKGTWIVGAEAGRMHLGGREEWFGAASLSWRVR